MLHVEHRDFESLTSCPICKAEDLVQVSSIRDFSHSLEPFLLADCATCGCRLTNPRPKQSFIQRYYSGPSYISHTNSRASITDRVYQVARSWTLRRKYRLIQRFHKGGHVLDLGCGTGEFLGYLKKRGFLVDGIEINSHARESALTNYGVRPHSNLDELTAGAEFQVITLWHVLEHLPDPGLVLKRLFALLKRDGVVIIAVPDRESWDAHHYGEHWAAWDVPRHLYHFRRQDVVRLLEEHGFVLLRTKPMWLDAFYVAMLSECYAGGRQPWTWALGFFNGFRSNLATLMCKTPTSSMLYIAQKGKSS